MKILKQIKALVAGPKSGWFGNFRSWEEATLWCTNYDNHLILEKVKSALLKVRDGEAAFERDSVLFYEPEYNWPFLASLLWAFGRGHGKLTIIDFGGSLGSTYFQHRNWLHPFYYSWNIIEQPHFVIEGKKYFETENLKFFNSIDEVKIESPTFLILSSVLPYLPSPNQWISEFLNRGYDYVFIDKTPLVEGNDRLTIQKVPKEIYEASYPAWFFNTGKFLGQWSREYETIADYLCEEKANFPAKFVGFFLMRKQ